MKVKLITPNEIEIGKDFTAKLVEVSEPVSQLFLQAINEPEVFVILDNVKHWIQNWDTAVALEYNLSTRKYVTLEEINKYKTGKTLNEVGDPEKPRDIYFPEEPPPVDGMKAVWANRVNLKEISKAGFDTMISFNFWTRTYDQQWETLEQAKIYGVKIIPVLHGLLKDSSYAELETLINRWKKNPWIEGWLLYDEPGLHGIPTTKQVEDYNRVKRLDSTHTIYMTYIAGREKSFYTVHASDQIIVTCYPVLKGQEEDYENILRRNLRKWIDETGNKEIIANMQAFHTENIEHKPWANPAGTLQKQYDVWRELGLPRRGYNWYAWIGGSGSGSRGITEITGLLEEVTKFNETK